MINIVCTSKPGDGLLRYSYEHCCYLNSIGIEAQLVIITHYNFSKKHYIDAITEKYKTCSNIVFHFYTPESDDITFILGRSMLTLLYKDKDYYTTDQLMTGHLLFNNKLITLEKMIIPVIAPDKKIKIISKLKFVSEFIM